MNKSYHNFSKPLQMSETPAVMRIIIRLQPDADFWEHLDIEGINELIKIISDEDPRGYKGFNTPEEVHALATYLIGGDLKCDEKTCEEVFDRLYAIHNEKFLCDRDKKIKSDENKAKLCQSMIISAERLWVKGREQAALSLAVSASVYSPDGFPECEKAAADLWADFVEMIARKDPVRAWKIASHIARHARSDDKRPQMKENSALLKDELTRRNFVLQAQTAEKLIL